MSEPFWPSVVKPPVVTLRRVDPSRNMARFYSMEVEQDLFGQVLLVRRWGRIGTKGRTPLDEHKDEGKAVAALAAIEAQKRRGGYRGPRTR